MWHREALPHDLYHICRNMRAADAAEIFLTRPDDRDAFAAQIWRMMPQAIFADVYGLDATSPAIVFVAAWPTDPYKNLAQAALFATEGFASIVGDFVRHMRRFVVPALLAGGVRRCECRTLASYTASRRLLAALGAVEEAELPDMGPNGEVFVQCAFRRSDFEGNRPCVSSRHRKPSPRPILMPPPMQQPRTKF